MHMNRNQRLELGPLDFGEISRRLINERVQQLEEGLVGSLHDLLVVPCVLQRFSGVAGPDQLQTQEANLVRMRQCG